MLLAQWVQYRSVPSEEDWEAAARHVAENAGKGDAFRVEPEWDSRPRVFLQDMDYVPAREATWFDVAPYERVWILLESGLESRAAAHMPPEWSPTTSPIPFGDVSVWLAERPRESVTRWDVLSALADAEVRREYADRTTACKTYEGGAFQAWHCPRRDPFLYVGETIQTVTNDTHRCLWAMPIDKGGRLVVSFDGVPGGRTLSGHYGQPIDAVRSKRGAPITFEVEVEGEAVHRKVFGLHEEGFLPWSVELPAGGGELSSVAFLVSSSDKQDRFFCFTARIVE